MDDARSPPVLCDQTAGLCFMESRSGCEWPPDGMSGGRGLGLKKSLRELLKAENVALLRSRVDYLWPVARRDTSARSPLVDGDWLFADGQSHSCSVPAPRGEEGRCG